MPKVTFPFVPTPSLLQGIDIVLARKRVLRGHQWTKTGYRESQGYSEQFLISHGFLADEHVSQETLNAAWKELSTKLAFFAAFPMRSAA